MGCEVSAREPSRATRRLSFSRPRRMAVSGPARRDVCKAASRCSKVVLTVGTLSGWVMCRDYAVNRVADKPRCSNAPVRWGNGEGDFPKHSGWTNVL
ncbi:MAG: hypothetical protein ACK56F_23260, partial [bacterium]